MHFENKFKCMTGRGESGRKADVEVAATATTEVVVEVVVGNDVTIGSKEACVFSSIKKKVKAQLPPTHL